MNLFGVGFLELAVIFLVTFLVMGPAKSIEMARTAGKLVGELRRTLNEMTAAVNLGSESTGSATPASRPQPPAEPASPPPTSQAAPPPPTSAIPTTGPGEGNEQQS